MQRKYGWLAAVFGLLAALATAKALGAAESTAVRDDGGGLLESCEIVSRGSPGPKDRFEAMRAGFCGGLIEGIAETLSASQIGEAHVYCPPDGLTDLERIHGVVRYLRTHKEEISNKPASQWYWGGMALMGTYPCE